VAKPKVIETILAKHDVATNGRKFNTVLATASINDAIEYFELFAEIEKQKAEQDPEFRPLNVACVFSPPAEATRTYNRFRKTCRKRKKITSKTPMARRQRSRAS
jgi:type I restriction enzyme R subunit